jgi:L-seryl-tRNA(Ser) seleniumtransferase
VSRLLSSLPQIDALLKLPRVAALVTRYSHDETANALRARLNDLRAALRAGETDGLPAFDGADFAETIEAMIEADRALLLKPVINATGILIHTNLGRAPLATEAIEAMQRIAGGTSNLELDLASGGRGDRVAAVEGLIRELTGAEAAFVVNNCAGAVMLALMGTANGRKVVVSRGELVEIGGAFRLPDIIEQSGARLKEVGTTNKTRVRDYADAVDGETAVLLKSHTSNFRIVGFTSAPGRAELAALAREREVLLIEDLGSGALRDLSDHGLGGEPVVGDVLAAGVDLTLFSGDKLLGGPQAGLMAGRAEVIGELRSHPLARALRIDKLSLAALEATLRLYRAPNDPFQKVPVLRMLSEPLEGVRARAERLAVMLRGVPRLSCRVVESAAQAGGGSLPGQDIPSAAVAIGAQGMSANRLASALRATSRPVIGRIRDDCLLLDMRSVTEADIDAIAAACAALPAR